MPLIMHHMGEPPVIVRNTQRNKPCPCGGKAPDGKPLKLKQCCWARETAFRNAAMTEFGTIHIPQLEEVLDERTPNESH